jgi:anti-sigma B factor antagonist
MDAIDAPVLAIDIAPLSSVDVGGEQERPDRDDELAISQSRYGTTTVVAVAGEVDLASCSRLRASLAAALGEPGRGPVVVDLTAVTFIGSTGIAVLVDADGHARKRDRSLRLVVDRGRAAVMRPLQATRVDEVLATYDDLDAALG